MAKRDWFWNGEERYYGLDGFRIHPAGTQSFLLYNSRSGQFLPGTYQSFEAAEQARHYKPEVLSKLNQAKQSTGEATITLDDFKVA